MSLRLFAALALPEDVADRLLALQAKLPGALWRPRENLHLTLSFFGDVAEPVADDLDAALDEAAARIPPFELSLKGAGAFGGAEPHALWAGVAKSEPLERLAAACVKAARTVRVKPDGRKYAPHVTLAYLRGAAAQSVQAYISRLGLFETRAFAVESFGLYSSVTRKSGPSLYRLEAEYELRG